MLTQALTLIGLGHRLCEKNNKNIVNLWGLIFVQGLFLFLFVQCLLQWGYIL